MFFHYNHQPTLYRGSNRTTLMNQHTSRKHQYNKYATFNTIASCFNWNTCATTFGLRKYFILKGKPNKKQHTNEAYLTIRRIANPLPGVETMIWHRVRMARRKSLWTWTVERSNKQDKISDNTSDFSIRTLFFTVPTVFLCQQTTCLNVKLLFANLLFEP